MPRLIPEPYRYDGASEALADALAFESSTELFVDYFVYAEGDLADYVVEVTASAGQPGGRLGYIAPDLPS